MAYNRRHLGRDSGSNPLMNSKVSADIIPTRPTPMLIPDERLKRTPCSTTPMLQCDIRLYSLRPPNLISQAKLSLECSRDGANKYSSNYKINKYPPSITKNFSSCKLKLFVVANYFISYFLMEYRDLRTPLVFNQLFIRTMQSLHVHSVTLGRDRKIALPT